MTEDKNRDGDVLQGILPYPRGRVVRALLFPLIRLYDVVAGIRNFLFDHGIFRVGRLDKPVISVGNLSMGGTGKTPVCSALTKQLTGLGLKVAILSRGYGRLAPETSRRVDPSGDWRFFGDEPMLLARRHPDALVCVGPSRFRAAAEAELFEPDVYLLDDGFQHRRLYRDADVVLLDVSQPKPDSWTADLFRERWRALKRADLVLLTRAEKGKSYREWKDRIAAVNPNAPVHEIGFQPRSVRFLDGRPDQTLAWLVGRSAGAYSGIARPERFFDSLRGLGAVLELTLPLGDHAPLSPERRQALVEKCRSQKIDVVLTTEKDAVKLDPSQKFGINLGFLPIEVRWDTLEPVTHLLKKWIPRVNE